jgi:hypothetical protein
MVHTTNTYLFHFLCNSETKNPVRDSTTITDRKCGAHLVCGVFRRTLYLPYHQPQSGLHKKNTPVQPYPGLRLCGGRYPPEDSAHCVRSAFPVGYCYGIPDGIFRFTITQKGKQNMSLSDEAFKKGEPC